MNEFSENILRISCAVWLFHSSVEKVQAEDLTSFLQPFLDINSFIEDRSNGSVSQEQAKKAADGFDKVGSKLSTIAATTYAVRNPIAGLPTAAASAALVPVTKDVGIHAGELQSVSNRMDAIAQKRDFSAVKELDREHSAIMQANANWNYDYGSTTETLSRLAKGYDKGYAGRTKKLSKMEGGGKIVATLANIWANFAGSSMDIDSTNGNSTTGKWQLTSISTSNKAWGDVVDRVVESQCHEIGDNIINIANYFANILGDDNTNLAQYGIHCAQSRNLEGENAIRFGEECRRGTWVLKYNVYINKNDKSFSLNYDKYQDDNFSGVINTQVSMSYRRCELN